MQFISPALVGAEEVFFVQGEEPEELAERVQAIIDARPPLSGISCFDLAGGGDGHSFIVKIGFLPGRLGPLRGPILFYSASDALELPKARANALVGVALNQELLFEPVIGSSQGTKFMGAIFLSAGII